MQASHDSIHLPPTKSKQNQLIALLQSTTQPVKVFAYSEDQQSRKFVRLEPAAALLVVQAAPGIYTWGGRGNAGNPRRCRFIRPLVPPPVQPATARVIPVDIRDSGVFGFLSYPQPNMSTSGKRFETLYRMGAGF